LVYSSTVKIEAVQSSEMSVNTTRIKDIISQKLVDFMAIALEPQIQHGGALHHI
jgi:hypothetical protein